MTSRTLTHLKKNKICTQIRSCSYFMNEDWNKMSMSMFSPYILRDIKINYMYKIQNNIINLIVTLFSSFQIFLK